jgi:O-antigen/teichoic acid export membrane protein
MNNSGYEEMRMKGARKVARNTIFLAIDAYVLDIINAVVAVLVARYLGARNLGGYSTANTFVYFGTVIANFGMRAVIVRDVASDPTQAQRYFSNATLVMGSMAAISSIGIFILSIFLPYPRIVQLAMLLAAMSLPFASVRRVAGGMIRAYQRMEIAAGLGILFTLLHAGGTLVILKVGGGILELMMLNLGLTVLRCSSFFFVVHRILVPFRFSFDRVLSLTVLKNAFPIALIHSFTMLIKRIDITMLSVMIGMEAVGFYNIPLRFLSFAGLPNQAFSGALLPHLAVRKSKSIRALQVSYERAQRLSLMVSFPVAILTFFMAEEIVGVVFGQEYLNGGSALGLKVLIWSLFVGMATGPVGGVLINTKEKLMKFIPYAAAVLALNVLLNLWWIPVWGFIGACASTVLCSIVQVVIKIWLVYRVFEGGPKVLAFAKRPALAGVVMAGVIYVTQGSNWMVAGVLGSLSYLVMLVVTGELGPRERAVGFRLIRDVAGSAGGLILRRRPMERK